MSVAIDTMSPEDWPDIRRIYLEGIATGEATFATDAPSWDSWDKDHLKSCRFVARDNGRVLGWAALSPVSGRCVYAGVAEVSVYVGDDARGRGVGGGLLQALVEQSERENLWTLQAGIFPENAASIAVHRRSGFREVGRREKIGKMRDRWRDVLLFERRSAVIV